MGPREVCREDRLAVPGGTVREGAPKARAEVGKVWVPVGQRSPEKQCC